MDLMGMDDRQYASTGGGQYIDKVPVHEPIRVQIARQVKSLETEMERLNQMIKLIDENPAIEKFINLQRGYVG